MPGPTRDQVTKERLDALLELLEQANVIDPGHVEDLDGLTELGKAKEAIANNPANHEVQRK